ncbi:hypothetical protein [Nocardia sp. NPDC057227]
MIAQIAQIAQIALHLAFEEWVEADTDAGLAAIHRTVCARRRTL